MNISSYKTILAKISEYMFPIFCLGCDKEGVWLCDACFACIQHPGVYCCPVCHGVRPAGETCTRCVPLSYLSRHVALFPYKEESLVGDIIRHVKYHYIEDLLVLLDGAVQRNIKKNPQHFAPVEAIIPVPLHKKRFAERGFNQAELIARMIERATSLPVDTALVRVRATPHQARLHKEERQKNVKDAFSAPPLPYRCVLLVDDVYTTGTTMQEAAKALRFAGVGEVRGFSVARG